MSKTVAYIRVSSTEQNLDRQLEEIKKLGIEEKYIYQDKQSGKDFERIGYQYMKKTDNNENYRTTNRKPSNEDKTNEEDND